MGVVFVGPVPGLLFGYVLARSLSLQGRIVWKMLVRGRLLGLLPLCSFMVFE